MVKTYMKSFTAFDGEKIKFIPYIEGKRPDIAKVKSIYLLSEGQIAVNYRLKLNKSNEWKVFDISIDGISLLRNYRSDFQNHVDIHGITSLIDSLEEKGWVFYFFYLNGLNDIINFGKSVKTANKATSIANPVNNPNIIVGTKLDRTSIEKPNIIVMLVKKIALPMLSCALYSDNS